jgi:hypothetical protein
MNQKCSQMNKVCYKSFMESCGAEGPLHVRVADRVDHGVTHQLLPQPFAVIGSLKNSDVSLNHADVRRRHAYLQVVDGHIYGVELGPSAADVVAKLLGEDQAISVGPFDVTPSLGECLAHEEEPMATMGANPLSSKYVGHGSLPEVELVFRNHVEKALSWRLTRVLTLAGKSPACKIRLESSSVSSFHCSLVRTPLGVWVVDLLGRGGISVNGMEVRFARLDGGDLLKVGNFVIGIRYGSPVGLADQRPRQRMLSGPALSKHHSGALATPNVPSVRRNPQGSSDELAVCPPSDEAVTERNDREIAVSRTPEIISPIDASTKMLFEQFGLMQQQMFDQFDRFVTVIGQTLGALHQDQMGQVRDELKQIRQLTLELSALKAEQAKLAQSSPGTAAPDPTELSTRAEPVSIANTANDVLSTDCDPALGGSGSTESIPFVGVGRSESAKIGSPTTADRERRWQPKQPAEGRDAPPSGQPSSSQTGEEIHLLLTRRIAQMQQEQQSRLQKIFSLVTRR